MKNKPNIILDCKKLLDAYKNGKLGKCEMPEDAHPLFLSQEERLTYFTLPMSLNYQRDSYKLWLGAEATFNDPLTKKVFDLKWCANASFEEVQMALTKYKVALQPNKHTQTWQKICKTIITNWGSLTQFFETHNKDFLQIKQTLQTTHKAGFPYLSGPKIFNYWSFIMSTYGQVPLLNKQEMSIAPDTHVRQASVKLGIIQANQMDNITSDELSAIWKALLVGTGIDSIEMHSPLWFWSRSGFEYKL